MTLQSFIQETLRQIADGAKESGLLPDISRNETTIPHTSINIKPKGMSKQEVVEFDKAHPDGPFERTVISIVHFDISLCQDSLTKDKGGIGVMLGSIGIGGSKQNEQDERTTSKVSFDIPIVLPRH